MGDFLEANNFSGGTEQEKSPLGDPITGIPVSIRS